MTDRPTTKKAVADGPIEDTTESARGKTSKGERPKTKGADILIVEPAEERPKTKVKKDNPVDNDAKGTETDGTKAEKGKDEKANEGQVQKVRDRVSDGKKIESGNIDTLNTLNEDGDLIIDKDKCRFYLFGCDVEGNDHEAKRPVKHLTGLNDAVIDKFRVINKVLDDDDKITSMFHAQKISTNSILCRESVQLVWPITNFNEVLRKGKNRLGEVLVSEPFRSECFGYQLQAVLIPYGRDRAFGRYVSFFVQLIPGPYDPILKWPFQDTITLILYDQNKSATSRMDYRFELTPSQEIVDDTYVGRPTAERQNGWLGTDNFVEIENILTDGDYLVDETVYFGVCISS